MDPSPTYTEEELVVLLKEQNREAFNYLYDNYSAVLFGVIRRMIADEDTAKDLLQESFVKIWNNISKYDPAKGRIYTWMINVTRNTVIDKMRSKGEIMRSKILREDNFVNNQSDGKRTERSTDLIGLNNMVAKLKPEYQKIVCLAYYEGYTLDEISKVLQMPLGTVKTRMRHAINLLRQNFSK